MQLSIVGCPDKIRFRPYVKRAALFYASELITPKMLENIYLRIKFNKKIDAYGYASVTEFGPNNKHRQFEIELDPGIGAYDILKTLAHEMVHAAQNRGLVQADLDSDLPGEGIEHIANSLAGVIMRRWGKAHPELFSRSQ